MAKPKHPTSKTVRQGQTIYVVEWIFPNPTVRIITEEFLHSHKTPLPPEGCVIEFPSVRLYKKFLTAHPHLNDAYFYSKRKAKRALAELNKSRQFPSIAVN